MNAKFDNVFNYQKKNAHVLHSAVKKSKKREKLNHICLTQSLSATANRNPENILWFSVKYCGSLQPADKSTIQSNPFVPHHLIASRIPHPKTRHIHIPHFPLVLHFPPLITPPPSNPLVPIHQPHTSPQPFRSAFTESSPRSGSFDTSTSSSNFLVVLIMNPGKELDGHLEHDSEQLAEFLASKERLRDRMTATRTDIHLLHSQMVDSRRDFDKQLERLRKQVAPLVPASHSKSKSPTAPPSTPAG